ncbi:MAG: hypothetical protein ABSD75_06800 [Terriglobales bacterium]|jgi:hypothetical protein
MVKKSIAAALLVVIVAWAEMMLAPMFVMHAWHTHGAHDMAAPMAAHNHNHAMPAGHPCCPRVNKTESADGLEIAALSLPCHNEHRCCFVRGRQNVPAPVSAGRKLSREIAAAKSAELTPIQSASRVSLASVVAPGSPPGTLGMILRI